LLSTGWFQERIRMWFHNQTKINWGPYGRLTNKCQICSLVKYSQNPKTKPNNCWYWNAFYLQGTFLLSSCHYYTWEHKIIESLSGLCIKV